MRVVLDTNILVSQLLRPLSAPGRAFIHAVDHGQLLCSTETLEELSEVVGRSKFDRYAPIEERRRFVELVGAVAELVTVSRTVRACRDPRDDKFLELAVAGAADVIVSGDGDLLTLDPFEGIAIMTPARFLTVQPE